MPDGYVNVTIAYWDDCVRNDVPLSAVADMLLEEMRRNGGMLPELAPKSPEELAELAEEWRNAGYDLELFEATGSRRLARAPESIEALVPGFIYRGKVHALLAAAENGKSTIAHELALKLSARTAADAEPLTWCGQPIQRGTRPGIVLFFSGEDDGSIVAARDRALQNAGLDGRGVAVIHGSHERLSAYLVKMKHAKQGGPGVPELIVIDPARAFLEGSEDQSENASRFLGALVEFAGRTNAAVLVLHHLAKNARPRSLEEVKACCRGSSVWIDRPRVLIGMYRSGGVTRVGVCKGNFDGLQRDSVALVFDKATGQHLVKTDAAHSKAEVGAERSRQAGETAPYDAAERVMAALVRLFGEGKRVTRSGKRDGLYELAPSELAGLARDLVRDTIAALVEAGRIAVEDGGLYPAGAGEHLPDAAE
jgi:hypothetical protein